MKKFTLKPELRKTLYSFLMIGIMILAAVGSLQLDLLRLNMRVSREYIGTGQYTETEEHQHEEAVKKTTGRIDKHGRWHGPVIIKWDGKESYTERATFEHGTRQGLSTREYPDGRKIEAHYLNGIQYELKKAAFFAGEQSAYQLLNIHYPWFPFSLNAWGYPDEYIQAFMDTIEIIIGENEFDLAEFDSYYSDAINALQDSRFDSLITFNSDISLLSGLEKLKDIELRLGLIDSYGTEVTLYETLNETYPGYLKVLSDSGVTSQDAEIFCSDLEDSLAYYGTLDRDDPFYTDSIDSWLFRALIGMIDMQTPGASVTHAWTLNNMKTSRTLLKTTIREGSDDVALIVVALMLPKLLEGDMIHTSIREAYILRKGITVPPCMSTAFLENSSATSAILEGCIIDNGGNGILNAGIAWDTIYNPTLEGNSVTTDVSSGMFTATINGLTEGKTYFARSFAQNVAGTGYGNCISFIAEVGTSYPERENNLNLSVYQDKSASFMVFRMKLPLQQHVILSIYNMKGQLVMKHDAGSLMPGENEIRLSSDGMTKGIYVCHVMHGSCTTVQKFNLR